jgi:hypothetical protein
MKYPADRQLLNIAQTYINVRIPTLKSRNSDALDFYNVSVWKFGSRTPVRLRVRLQSRAGRGITWK